MHAIFIDHFENITISCAIAVDLSHIAYPFPLERDWRGPFNAFHDCLALDIKSLDKLVSILRPHSSDQNHTIIYS